MKMRDVCKVLFDGINEPLNVTINRATLGGLISAYGKDSREWINHTLTVLTEKGKVSGRNVVYLFLIPAGYTKTEDSNGYDVIVKEGEQPEAQEELPVIDFEDTEPKKVVTPF